MQIVIVRRKDLKRVDYNENARHLVLPNGVEIPMMGITSTRVPLIHSFDRIKEELKNEIVSHAYKCAKRSGLYGDDHIYVVDSLEPIWLFDCKNKDISNGSGTTLAGYMDFCIPFRQVLEF